MYKLGEIIMSAEPLNSQVLKISEKLEISKAELHNVIFNQKATKVRDFSLNNFEKSEECPCCKLPAVFFIIGRSSFQHFCRYHRSRPTRNRLPLIFFLNKKPHDFTIYRALSCRNPLHAKQ